MENNLVAGRRWGPRGPGVARPLSAARTAILDRLREQPEPLTLVSLVTFTGLHENTVREHLTALVRRGLVRRFPTEPVGRGRPAWLYELADDGTAGSEYARLAAVLAGTIARTSDDPGGTAAAAGEAWGRELARDRRAVRVTAEAARDHVLALLGDLGFGPETASEDPAQVRLTQCPLLEAAYRQREVVCAVHLGIVRGALSEYGADPDGSALEPFAEPGACRLVVPPLEDASPCATAEASSSGPGNG